MAGFAEELKSLAVGRTDTNSKRKVLESSLWARHFFAVLLPHFRNASGPYIVLFATTNRRHHVAPPIRTVEYSCETYLFADSVRISWLGLCRGFIGCGGLTLSAAPAGTQIPR